MKVKLPDFYGYSILENAWFELEQSKDCDQMCPVFGRKLTYEEVCEISNLYMMDLYNLKCQNDKLMERSKRLTIVYRELEDCRQKFSRTQAFRDIEKLKEEIERLTDAMSWSEAKAHEDAANLRVKLDEANKLIDQIKSININEFGFEADVGIATIIQKYKDEN